MATVTIIAQEQKLSNQSMSSTFLALTTQRAGLWRFNYKELVMMALFRFHDNHDDNQQMTTIQTKQLFVLEIHTNRKVGDANMMFSLHGGHEFR